MHAGAAPSVPEPMPGQGICDGSEEDGDDGMLPLPPQPYDGMLPLSRQPYEGMLPLPRQPYEGMLLLPL